MYQQIFFQQEKEKFQQYQDRVLNVELVLFTRLTFSANNDSPDLTTQLISKILPHIYKRWKSSIFYNKELNSKEIN